MSKVMSSTGVAEQIEERVAREFVEYQRELEGLSGREVLERVYQYCDKELINDSIQSGFLREEPSTILDNLISCSGNLLEAIYWKSLEYMDLREPSDVMSVIIGMVEGNGHDLDCCELV